MKHNWQLLTPRSGPLAAVADVRAPTRYEVGWRLLCSSCEECLDVPYDVLDSDNIAAFVEKQGKRDDCPGKKNSQNPQKTS